MIKFLAFIICSVSGFVIRIIHTNDLHSHFLGAGPDGNYLRADGGFARLSQLIRNLQNIEPESTLTVDAGDFSGGSIYALLSRSSFTGFSAEFDFFQTLNYDAITLGNHEFDGGIRLFSEMLNKSENCDVPIVLSNGELESIEIPHWEDFDPPILPTRISEEKNCNGTENIHRTRITPFVLKRLQNGPSESLVVAIFGLMGPNAMRLISKKNREGISVVGFDVSGEKENLEEYSSYVSNLARSIREKFDVDFIIALAHSGEPEDRLILDKIASFQHKGTRLIDVHISAHTHERHDYFHEKTTTFVSQNPGYGLEVGFLEILYNKTTKEMKLMNDEKKRYTINSEIPDDPFIVRKIAGYNRLLDSIFIQQRKGKLGDFDFYKTVHFPEGLISSLDDGTGRKMLDWVSTCFINETNKELAQRGEPKVDMYILSHEFGMFFRDNIFKFRNQTDVVFSDVYRWFGVGTTGDLITLSNWIGEDIMFFYMKKREVKIMVNFWQLMKDRSGSIDINLSLGGITFERNRIGVPFLDHPRFGWVHSIRSFGTLLDDMPQDLIKVAARKSLIAHFSAIPSYLSYGLVQLYTYDRYGNVRDPVTSKMKEIELMFLKCLS